jgi:molybdenum cofactor cytidylyltransferase
MGQPKLLLPFGTSTVVGATVAALRGGGATTLVLVTAPGDEPLAAWGRQAGLQVTANPEPERGMLRSLWAGIEALGGAAAVAARGEPLLVCPADLPRLRASTVAALLAELVPPALLVVPRCGRQRGHPLVVAAAAAPAILELDCDVGLRQLRLRLQSAGATVEVEVADPGTVLDVDTPEDYRALADFAD